MKFKRNESFQLKEISGDWILVARGNVAIDFGAVVVFNDTGVLLWQTLAEWKTAQELAAVLVTQCEAPQDAAEKDVQTFLDKLSAEGLLEKQ